MDEMRQEVVSEQSLAEEQAEDNRKKAGRLFRSLHITGYRWYWKLLATVLLVALHTVVRLVDLWQILMQADRTKMLGIVRGVRLEDPILTLSFFLGIVALWLIWKNRSAWALGIGGVSVLCAVASPALDLWGHIVQMQRWEQTMDTVGWNSRWTMKPQAGLFVVAALAVLCLAALVVLAVLVHKKKWQSRFEGRYQNVGVCKPLSVIAWVLAVLVALGGTAGTVLLTAMPGDDPLFAQGRFCYYDGKNYGAVNRYGFVAIDAAYEHLFTFGDNGLAWVYDRNQVCYVTRNGKEKMEFRLGSGEIPLGNFKNGLAVCFQYPQSGGVKYGYLNTEGFIVIECDFDYALNFADNGLAAVLQDDKWGFIDTEGNLVIDFQYEIAGDFTEYGLAPVLKDGKWGYIDEKGKTVIDFQYDAAMNVAGNGFASVQKDGKWGAVDTAGKTVVPCQYDAIRAFSKIGLAAAEKDGKWGFIDQSGKVVIDFQFAWADGVFGENGLMAVKKDADGLYGYIDRNGKWKIEPQFNFAYDFQTDGYAAVEMGQLTGVINSQGEFVILPSLWQLPVEVLTCGMVVG